MTNEFVRKTCYIQTAFNQQWVVANPYRLQAMVSDLDEDSDEGVCDIIYNTEPKGLRDHVVTLHFKTSYGAYQLSYSECPNGVHLEKIGDKQDDRTSLFIQKYCENNTYKFQCEKNENLWLCVKDKQLDLHHFGDPRVEYEFTIHKRV